MGVQAKSRDICGTVSWQLCETRAITVPKSESDGRLGVRRPTWEYIYGSKDAERGSMLGINRFDHVDVLMRRCRLHWSRAV